MKNTFTVKLSKINGDPQDVSRIENVVSIMSNMGGFLISSTDNNYQLGSDTILVIVGSDDNKEGRFGY